MVGELVSGKIVMGGKGPRRPHIPPDSLSLPHVVGLRQVVLLMRVWLLQIGMEVEKVGPDVLVRWWWPCLTARGIMSGLRIAVGA